MHKGLRKRWYFIVLRHLHDEQPNSGFFRLRTVQVALLSITAVFARIFNNYRGK